MAQTDNSHLKEKVRLRLNHLPVGPVRVLDAFGGFGTLWKEVIKRSNRSNIEHVSIDKQVRSGALKGDNRKYLKGMDLSRYNVIDLDAYGIPFEQMEIILKRGYEGGVFFTFIQSLLGQIPKRLCSACGVTRPMYQAAPTLWGQIGWELWLDYLGNHGITRLSHITINRIHYGFFELTKTPVSV